MRDFLTKRRDITRPVEFSDGRTGFISRTNATGHLRSSIQDGRSFFIMSGPDYPSVANRPIRARLRLFAKVPRCKLL
jgi:hypothetical protein